MPIRPLALATLACVLLPACVTPSTERSTALIGNYKVMVTDRIGVRELSQAEQNDPRLRTQIEACQRANGANCLEAPVLGEARNVFERGTDHVVAIALIARPQPGLHFGSCWLTGPTGETFVSQAPITVGEYKTETDYNLSGCEFPLQEGKVWARGVWQVEVILDGTVLARPTFTIRERGELEA